MDKLTPENVRSASEQDLTLQSFPWTNVDLLVLIAAAQEIRANPYDMLLVFMRESRLNPSATVWADDKKTVIGIVGLNQFTQEAVIGTFYPDLIVAPGVYKDSAFKRWQEFARAYREMAPSGQLPFIVDYFKLSPLYKAGKPFPNATSLYAANFNIGASAATNPNHVFYKGPPPGGCYRLENGKKVLTDEGRKPEWNLYCQNEGMDVVKGDGGITLGDLPAFLAKVQNEPRYLAAAERLRRLIEGAPTSVFLPGL